MVWKSRKTAAWKIPKPLKKKAQPSWAAKPLHELPPEKPPEVAWLEDAHNPQLFSACDVELQVGRKVPNLPLPWFRLLRPERDNAVRCTIPAPVAYPGRATMEVNITVPALVDALSRGVSVRGKVVVGLVWHKCSAGYFLAHPDFKQYNLLLPPTPGPRWPAGVFTLPVEEARRSVAANFERAYWHNLFIRALNIKHAALMGGRSMGTMRSIFKKFGFTRNFHKR